MWRILRLFLLVYGGVLIVFYAIQTKLIFPGNRDMSSTPESRRWAYEDLTWSVSGATTNAWFIPAPGKSRGAILYSHGNAESIASCLEVAALYRTLGFDVLLYDYGGYGHSTGRPSEQRCYADIRAAWKWLTEERKIAPERIVLFGRSVGGGPTADLAVEVKPGAIVLESTFRSVATLGQELFRILPVKWLVRHRFDTESKITRFQAPVLIVHSPQDEIIPFRHGKKLFELAPEPKQFLEISGGHNDGVFVSAARYREGLTQFFKPLFPE